jgi:hypothetical protein
MVLDSPAIVRPALPGLALPLFGTGLDLTMIVGSCPRHGKCRSRKRRGQGKRDKKSVHDNSPFESMDAGDVAPTPKSVIGSSVDMKDGRGGLVKLAIAGSPLRQPKRRRP